MCIRDSSTILATGDAEADVEDALLRSGTDLTADILKVGHHGSKTSTTDAFLDAVNPTIALISSGRENRFGHPHAEVTDRLEQRGVLIYRTDNDGSVVLRAPKTYTMRLDASPSLTRRPLAPLLAP